MLGVWSTTVGLHPAEVALSLICMSLKSHQLSHLHFSLPVFALSPLRIFPLFFLFLILNLTYPPFTPLLLPVRLRPAFLFSRSSHLQGSAHLLEPGSPPFSELMHHCDCPALAAWTRASLSKCWLPFQSWTRFQTWVHELLINSVPNPPK